MFPCPIGTSVISSSSSFVYLRLQNKIEFSSYSSLLFQPPLLQIFPLSTPGFSAFSRFGNITDAIVLKDRETGRSRGFGFITFESAEEAEAAIQGMNEQDLDGRQIRVNLANERPAGGDRGGFGGNRGW